MAARVLAVANQKGGVGKTTTALTLSSALGNYGKRTLAVDLDPHVSASIHLRCYPEEMEATVFDLFVHSGPELAAVWSRVRLWEPGKRFEFAPGHKRLSDLEVDLSGRKGKGLLLKRALESVLDEYDYIVLDCPPHLGVLLVNALVAADLLVVPLQTDFMAVHGLKLLFETVGTLNKLRPTPLRYKVLPTMFDARASACRRVLQLLREKLGENMFSTIVHMDTKFREASAQGRTVSDAYPESRGALEYQQLAKEIISHEQKS
ncbi:ParA family protein [Megalodesulfovibrio gigas]|uniref:ParA family protein n=2 Tax=Megalodesulfovibrio gigas TaxID=879 RepID=T2G6Q0_MEGG1|nr:ParA family protein [Megalodesulfovibrio gigas]AAX37304.1 ParA family protein [Megalodesulfovibrio gigas]AGW11963.1 ParA family protein [Megalodesulfovibrio gigas DSM 1382 = ATCC 19364]